ncbi:MAG: diacylglycerol kinase [Lachnospiraceae bacterium]|nr:diacylglycerol kinase [Lachnospiraceae bacterium]
MPYQKPDKKNVFKHIFQNISDSNHGLAIMFRESTTVKRLIPIELIGGIVLGLLFGFIPLEYIILAFILVILFTVETLNTAIEEVNDLVTLEENERVRRSKDIASGSVAVWHLIYVVCVFTFIFCHLAGFPWWLHIM